MSYALSKKRGEKLKLSLASCVPCAQAVLVATLLLSPPLNPVVKHALLLQASSFQQCRCRNLKLMRNISELT